MSEGNVVCEHLQGGNFQILISKIQQDRLVMVYMKENLTQTTRSNGDSEGITINGVLEVNDVLGVLDYVANCYV